VPREGCLLENGWNVCNYGDAEIKDAYLRQQELLGEPISGFDSRCQTFRFGRLCYNAANAKEWRVEWANLGLQDYTAKGYVPQPGTEPHAAVRDYLIAAMEVGIDIPRTVGRLISQPVCDRGLCRQWSDKQVWIFPQDAQSWHQVQRAPLGLEHSHPRVADGSGGAIGNAVPLIAGIGLGLAGIALLVSRRAPTRRGATI
jgi:hypothetical protein